MFLTTLAVLGAFLGFANPFYQFPPAVLFFPACLALLAIGQPNTGRAFRQGWIAGSVAFTACLYWVAVPVHYYGHLHWLLAIPCPVLLGMYMGLYTGMFCLGIRIVAVRLDWFGFGAFAGLWWTILEILRGTLFTGFPWLTLPQAFAGWPQTLQAASAIGSLGVCSLMVAGACWPAVSAIPARSKTRPLVMTVALFVGLLLFGSLQYSKPVAPSETVRVGVAQANIDQSQKWDPDFQNSTVERHITLSKAVLETQNAELIVWPETALPFYLQEITPLQREVLGFARDNQVALITGSPGYERTKELGEFNFYNRAYLISPDGVPLASYDKTHLLPFGEYVPFNNIIGFLSKMVESEGDFTPGTAAQPLQYGNLAMGMLICYEVIFPGLTQKRVAAGANILINLSNDAWFGRTSAPLQHLHLSVLRSIEQGRYLIRATNTGISAFIDPHGKVIVESGLFRAQALGAEVGLVESTTLYHRISRYITPALVLLLALFTIKALIRPIPGYNPPRKSNVIKPLT